MTKSSMTSASTGRRASRSGGPGRRRTGAAGRLVLEVDAAGAAQLARPRAARCRRPCASASGSSAALPSTVAGVSRVTWARSARRVVPQRVRRAGRRAGPGWGRRRRRLVRRRPSSGARPGSAWSASSASGLAAGSASVVAAALATGRRRAQLPSGCGGRRRPRPRVASGRVVDGRRRASRARSRDPATRSRAARRRRRRPPNSPASPRAPRGVLESVPVVGGVRVDGWSPAPPGSDRPRPRRGRPPPTSSAASDRRPCGRASVDPSSARPARRPRRGRLDPWSASSAGSAGSGTRRRRRRRGPATARPAPSASASPVRARPGW